ncbi:hypothetical protein GCM10018785_24440 [Streptomyces longispororuber]|uniref:Protein kinase domain-containing protein n=1 Tax=Streptomyces longispororuber TaxID=68230 RepID=A0A919DKK5_9ACTN|nr:hypothetical protein [Streptomyces longispororuber]GHE54079.1 hypothetical protein GCM10018785_24440 [Streptomyces longispororuber]
MGPATGSQRRFPSGAEYAEALQHTQLCFHHPELKGARPELTGLGLPRPISGAFASVFSLTSPTSGRRYAVKCFTRHVPEQERRYEAISSRLALLDPAELSQPWNLGFEYLPDAISVGRERYPVLKMEWAEAVTLSSWLDDNHADRIAVDRLADRFEELTRDLADHQIAHGDLQHGNLLVASDDTLRLVDYDGMYVPALAGLGGTERGHRNYQSPLRGNDDFGVDLDRFSTWVIFLSLKAIASEPALWSRLHEPSGEFLLLTEEDFTSPAESARLQTLLTHPDRMVSGLADQVRTLACQPLDMLPPLTLAVPRQRPAATVITDTTAHSGATAPGAGGLPDWMAGHITSAASPPQPAPSVAPPDRFQVRTPLDVAVAVVWPLMLAVTVLALFVSLSTAPFGPAVPVLAAVAFSVFGRARRTEWTQARAVLSELTAELGQLDDPLKAEGKLRKDRAKFDAAETKRTADHPRAQSKLTASYQAELQQIEKRRIRKRQELDKKIAGLSAERGKALRTALAARQSAYVRDRLGGQLIARNPPYGIGPKLAARLAAAGVRTAADFTGYRTVQNAQYNSVGAELVLSNGRRIDVQGIGEAKAIALDVWRRQLVAAAEADQPTALTAQERQSIDQGIEVRRTRLTTELRSVDAAAEAARTKAQQELEDGQARLTQENALADERARRQRKEFSRRAVTLQQNSARHAALSSAAETAEAHRRRLSLVRYLRFLYTGR